MTLVSVCREIRRDFLIGIFLYYPHIYDEFQTNRFHSEQPLPVVRYAEFLGQTTTFLYI